MNDTRPGSRPAAVTRLAPGILQSLGLCVFFALVTIVVSTLVGLCGIHLDDATSLLVRLAIAWPATFWLARWWSRGSFRGAFRLTRFPLSILAPLLIATFGGTIVLASVVGAIPVRAAKVMALGADSGVGVVGFLAAVVAGPLAEELFFRGWVLRGYLSRYSTAVAVVASAALFGAFHVNPWQALYTASWGIVWAWLVRQTGSLVPSMVSHAAVNFSVMFLLPPLGLALGYDSRAREALEAFPPSMIAIGIGATVIGGVTLWWLVGAQPSSEKPTNRGRALEVASTEEGGSA